MEGMSLEESWDLKFLRNGHTGYDDPIIYSYDQPLRLRMVKKIICSLYPDGLKGMKALDIGCGTGDFIQLLLDKGIDKVTALDISPKVVEAARRRFQYAKDKVEVEVGAVQELPLDEHELDLVTSITVLQHVVEDGEVVAAMRSVCRALKVGGYMIALEIAPTKKVAPSNPITIKERTLREWKEIFLNGGLSFAEKPRVYSPLGFCLIQLWIPGLLSFVFGGGWRLSRSRPKATTDQNRYPKGSLLRRAYSVLRRIVLKLTYPVDYLLDFKVPPSLAYYHFFVLQRVV